MCVCVSVCELSLWCLCRATKNAAEFAWATLFMRQQRKQQRNYTARNIFQLTCNELPTTYSSHKVTWNTFEVLVFLGKEKYFRATMKLIIFIYLSAESLMQFWSNLPVDYYFRFPILYNNNFFLCTHALAVRNPQCQRCSFICRRTSVSAAPTPRTPSHFPPLAFPFPLEGFSAFCWAIQAGNIFATFDIF